MNPGRRRDYKWPPDWWIRQHTLTMRMPRYGNYTRRLGANLDGAVRREPPVVSKERIPNER